MAEVNQITQMTLSDTKYSRTSVLSMENIKTILNNLFWILYYNSSISSSPHSLRSVLGLMQQIADGRAIRRAGFGFGSPEAQDEYLNGLAATSAQLTDIDTSSVRFDATGLSPYGCPYLYYWASTADEDPIPTTLFPTPESVVAQTFQLLKRSGGVTLDLACTVPTDQRRENVYYMALRSSFPYWVQCLQSDPSLHPGWSRLDEDDDTPLSAEITSRCYNDQVGNLVVSTMTDDAINAINVEGESLVSLAVAYNRLCTLRTLLLRPELNLNSGDFSLPKSSGLSSENSGSHLHDAMRQKRLTDANRLQITAVFDDVALVFSQIPFWIHNAVYYGYHLTLDLPVCMIIYHYYRVPYPHCKCNPTLAAAAPTKHSPFRFCFP